MGLCFDVIGVDDVVGGWVEWDLVGEIYGVVGVYGL